MLSYRHAFHAGNFADVLKHVVLVEVLSHLTQKDTAFEYVDTHSGAGVFPLNAPDTQKLQEYKHGISALREAEIPGLGPYLGVVDAFNAPGVFDTYPGSPSIAAHFLRRQDRAWLCELHPADFTALSTALGRRRNIRVFREDGFATLNGLVPLKSRRGVVLIDPSYEVKTEYEAVVDAVVNAHRKFATGLYLLWYPVVERERIDQLESRFVNSGIKHIQRFELGVAPDSDEKGMTASGVIVVNPPWTLFKTMDALLPALAAYLGDPRSPQYRCDVLASE